MADLTTISTEAKSALLSAGITTVAAMVDAGPAKFQAAMEKGKVVVAPSTAESVLAGLGVVTQVAGLGR